MGRSCCSESNSNRNNKVKQVIQLLQPLSKDQADFCCEATVDRYLRARGGNVKKAAKQLRASLAWRASVGLLSRAAAAANDQLCSSIAPPHPTAGGHLTADEFPAELASGAAFVAGHDANGLPVLIVRLRPDLLAPKHQKRFLRFLVFSFEVAVASMPAGVEQWVMLVDFGGCPSNAPFSFVLSMLKLIGDHYPDRLAPSFFVDAPSVFYYMWKGMAPFFDQVTRLSWKFAFLKDHHHSSQDAVVVQEQQQVATGAATMLECDEVGSCSRTPSFRRHQQQQQRNHGCCSYEERLSAMSFLTPLSSPGSSSHVSLFNRGSDHHHHHHQSLGAALLASSSLDKQQQHRSLSFSSPASRSSPVDASRNSSNSSFARAASSPVFLRSSRSRRNNNNNNNVSSSSSTTSCRAASVTSSSSWHAFRPYVRLCRCGYDEVAYRSSMKPPLGGVLSVAQLMRA